MSLQLINTQGQVWDGSSRLLHDAYDTPYSGGEFSEYAVINLGFLAINVYGYSAQVRLRPNFTADAAFDSLYRCLRSRPFDRIVMTFWDDEKQNVAGCWSRCLGTATLSSRAGEMQRA